MTDSELHKTITIIVKKFLRDRPTIAKRLTTHEIVNEAYLIVKAGKYGVREDGDLAYAVYMAADSRYKSAVHVRFESQGTVYAAKSTPIENLICPQDGAVWIDFTDAVDSLCTSREKAAVMANLQSQYLSDKLAISGMTSSTFYRHLESGVRKLSSLYDN